nr:ABC transporter ATP-binding protein [Rhodoplanes sp.]
MSSRGGAEPGRAPGRGLAAGRDERRKGDPGLSRGEFEAVLDVKAISAGYGDMKVLDCVSLTVESGEAVSLVGSNGAGKTTLLRAISGLVPVWSGSIVFDGQDLGALPAHKLPALGIAHIPQGRGVLTQLTVKDNLLLGGYVPAARERRPETMKMVYDLFPVLREKESQLGGSLSGGQQQMLAIARALMSHPKLLILDEPSLGLAPIMVEAVFEIIKTISGQGVSLLLVEQNLAEALAVSTRAYVLETGRVVLHGASDELANNEHVRTAYLGI